MRLSYTIGPLLILTLLSSFGPLPGQTLQAVKPGIVLQTGAQQYVTLLPKVPSGSPSPWLIYPTSSTVWVAGIGTNPVSSQIREFFVNETSKVLLSLPNVIVSSILADPVKPSTKVWFTENSTLAFYDTSNSTQTSATRAITFQDQSIQYLANDTHGRIWMSMVASSGASTIGMYDPSTHLNQTYAVPTNGTIVQGITVNALGDTIWFAEAGSRKIGRLVPGASQPFSEYSPPSSVSLSAPIQVAVDASGGVWFTDHGSNQFGVFNPQTSLWKVFPIGYCPDNCAVYGLPNAIFVDAKNNVWFSEHIAGRIARYDPSREVLTEYFVPGGSAPEAWWAMPGPDNLVWFVAGRFGEIGYVNASIPVSFSLSNPLADVVVQRGSSLNIPVRVSSQGSVALSFGLSPVTRDQPLQFPAQVYGSSPSNLTLDNNFQTATFGVSAAWNATLEPRYIALTASNGQVAVSVHVRVAVAEASAPFVALGFMSVIALGGFALYLRRPKKPKAQSVKRTRR